MSISMVSIGHRHDKSHHVLMIHVCATCKAGRWFCSFSAFGGFLKWGCSQIIHFNGFFHYKPSIFGYPHDYGNPPLFLGLPHQLEPRHASEDLIVAGVGRGGVERVHKALNFLKGIPTWSSCYTGNFLK